MDEARPKIFISTVTKELKRARGKVADTLRLLHYQPILQEDFSNHTGVVREMLEKELAPCAAVIQIVGHRYGCDVHGAAHPSEVMSYTQYEACYAHRKAIPVWYLIISDDYPVDEPNDEDEMKKVFQSAYRYRLQSTGHLRYTVADIKDVELAVFRMQQNLDSLRPLRCQQLPLLASSNGPQIDPPPEAPSIPGAADLEKMMRSVLSELVPALHQVKNNISPQDNATAEDNLYARLAEILNKTPDEARSEIQALAQRTRADPTQPLLERAKAAYALRDYPAAEKLALQAAKQAASTTPAFPSSQIAALCQAGEAATEQTCYQVALEHYHAAAALTSKQQDLLLWARIQNEITWLHYLDGQHHVQGDHIKQVWQACQQGGHPEHPITLRSHHLWANTLYLQGNHGEAEEEHRAVLSVRERVFGPEHPETLKSRMNLATALATQGRHVEAEQEHRTVLGIRERVLGPEHPDVFTSCYNLAVTLHELGQQSNALEFARRALAGRIKVLGNEHPRSQNSVRQVEELEALAPR